MSIDISKATQSCDDRVGARQRSPIAQITCIASSLAKISGQSQILTIKMISVDSRVIIVSDLAISLCLNGF
jgi:hypothetical protein